MTMPTMLLAAALLGRADSLVVSPEWLAAHRNDPHVVVLHVSMEREDYIKGHVPGARWVNPHDFFTSGSPGGKYDGSDHSEQLPRSGHIPGGINLPWEKTFTDGAGVSSASDLVTYCTVGLRASHLYFIARYLGLTPRLYDGSMSEWSRVAELPMVTGSTPR